MPRLSGINPVCAKCQNACTQYQQMTLVNCPLYNPRPRQRAVKPVVAISSFTNKRNALPTKPVRTSRKRR